MKTSILTFAVGLIGACLLADMPTRPQATALGGAILLDNDELIEGAIYREGDRVIVRRGASETAIPAKRVVEIVADRKAAVQAMRVRSNPRDPDERYRLIRWCMANGLRAEALEEAEAFLRIRPDDSNLKGLVDGLRDLGPAQTNNPTLPKKNPGKVIEVDPQDYNPESFGMFASKVQPILMNLCIGCHANDKGGTYHLLRGEIGDRKTAIHNLTATLKFVNRRNLAESPFLLRSITAHGGAVRPPLRDREHPAYSNLETWVLSAVDPEENEPLPVEANVEKKKDAKSNGPTTHFGETSKSKPLPVEQTEAKDPFDPAIFNGTIRPKK